MTEQRACERPGCGESFTPKAENQRYHDARCARRAERQRRKARERPVPEAAKRNLLEPVSPHTPFSPTEIETALTTLVLTGGKPGEAARELRQHGLEIGAQTLSRWKNHQYAERYRRIAEDIVPQRYQDTAVRIEAGLDKWLEAQEKALKKLIELIPEADVKDASNIVRNIATGLAINIDKASLIRGRPTEIRSTESAQQILRTIKQKWGDDIFNAIDSTAEEVKE